MHVVALIIAKKSNVVLTDWCSPIAERYLSAHGVKVVSFIGGTVEEVLLKFQTGLKTSIEEFQDLAPKACKIDRRVAVRSVRTAFNQIISLLPVMTGVVFLLGLFSAFISKGFLASIFSGSMWWDCFWGASIGSAFAGNPINSYIIGGQMLERGVSLVGVTAFITSWVTVGLVQLPAESAALGWKFAVVRNSSCFVLSMAIAFLTMVILKAFGT
jgi:hypothetical protein